MSHFELLLAHFAPNLNFGKCLRREDQMQGKSLVIYSKCSNLHFFGILELEMTDFRNF